jgi:hypothetical protein
MGKTLIVLATYDGISSMFSGVGKVSEQYATILRRLISAHSGSDGDRVTFAIADVYYAPSNSSLDPHRLRRHTADGTLYYALPTTADGVFVNECWGEAVWESASVALATLVGTLSADYDDIMVYANDTMFAAVRIYLERFRFCRANVTIHWIPHSLASFFRDRYTTDARMLFEQGCIDSLVRNGDYVIAVNEYVRSELESVYGVPPERVVGILNGLLDEEPVAGAGEVPDASILLVGRCTEQKAFDFALPVLREQTAGLPLAVHCLAPCETSGKQYVAIIDAIRATFPPGKLVFESAFAADRSLALFRGLTAGAVVFPARYEAAPLAPLEALRHCRPSIPIVYSEIPPHREIFAGIPNTLAFAPDDSSAFAAAVGKALGSRYSGARALPARYDIAANFERHFLPLIGRLAR